MGKTKTILGYAWTVLLIICLLAFIIAFAFAVPIWFRPFYYMQIKPLDIEATSGFSYDRIIAAYNDVLDYLNFGTPFGVGDLKYSESGKSHFEDCKILFDLDLWGLIVSAVVLLAGFLLAKFANFKPRKIGGFDFSFYSGVVGAVIPPVVGIAMLVDFEGAFTLFHTLFFPGKDNWYFDPFEDEVIRILPAEFFMNCGILIIVIWFALCIAFIVRGIVKKKKAAIAASSATAVSASSDATFGAASATEPDGSGKGSESDA